MFVYPRRVGHYGRPLHRPRKTRQQRYVSLWREEGRGLSSATGDRELLGLTQVSLCSLVLRHQFSLSSGGNTHGTAEGEFRWNKITRQRCPQGDYVLQHMGNASSRPYPCDIADSRRREANSNWKCSRRHLGGNFP
ncbi:hypothetical protein E2C01_036203 [Portunus trituberculatus]|uniref:Uncharacterized protein n=1 Tax=Portunus trituberculatus TaxID=210409 RepID=A0A5B7FBU8_PORTR|nr:hypothetical protein [Portunus trituberculatus]